MESLSSKTVGGLAHEMIVNRICSCSFDLELVCDDPITVSVHVCLIHEPWKCCPHIIAGGTCND